MTLKEYNRLPPDVKAQISSSLMDFCNSENRALTSPEQLREFIRDIDWRVDSGLMYPEHLKEFNPQGQ